MTEYQRQMRRRITSVSNHVTASGSGDTVDRVCSLPRHPDADHLDLPEGLKTPAMQEGKFDALNERRYRRLDIDEAFPACKTTFDPLQQGQRVSNRI